ncbi:hypothetical protein DPMN_116870 [Dreissena polymorpha]|nr:hypothetical protein DPMN_116870 [Dreissena polymorpha]
MQASSEITPTSHTEKEVLFDRQNSLPDASRTFLVALAEGRSQDPAVKAFLAMSERYSRQHNISLPGSFTADHPVEEVGR